MAVRRPIKSKAVFAAGHARSKSGPKAKVTAKRLGRKTTLVSVKGPKIRHSALLRKGRGIGITVRTVEDEIFGNKRRVGIRKVGRGPVRKKRK